MATDNAQTLQLRPSAMSFRPLLLLLGVALAVAAGVTVVLWWRGPDWSLLYGNLADSDASSVVQALQTAGIQYKLDGGNAVMVPAEKVHDARLKLAAQGLPAGSNQGGIDLISKESGFGVSQLMESARYQYALENELARTIASMRAVEAARVHLAMAQQSAFVTERRSARASVMLQLRNGRRLESEQVSAIVHLVASSIPELDAKDVTVVDQQGRLLSAPGGASSASSEQFAAAQRLEDNYVQRIEQLLSPMLGVGRVKAQVTVDLDPTASEEAREQYKPDGQVVRSEQSSEQSTRNGATAAGGVPGALSNQPPTGGTAIPAPNVTAANATPAAAGATKGTTASAVSTVASTGPESSSKESTRNYEIDRTLSYTRQPGGGIKRLTVAVLLDNLRSVDKDGKATAQALSAAQIDDITRLVKNAVGYNEQRGDSVNVVNAAFTETSEIVAQDSIPIWQRPWLLNIARLALGAILLLLIVLLVLRPLLRNLTSAFSAVPAMSGGGGATALTDERGDGSTVATPISGNQPLAYEQQIVQARNLVAQDPKRVAQVVKNWVNE